MPEIPSQLRLHRFQRQILLASSLWCSWRTLNLPMRLILAHLKKSSTGHECQFRPSPRADETCPPVSRTRKWRSPLANAPCRFLRHSFPAGTVSLDPRVLGIPNPELEYHPRRPQVLL